MYIDIFIICQDCSDFPDLANLGPGHLPFHPGGGDVEFAGVLASVVPVAVRFVSEFILWNLAKKL